ncbi:collagenase [Shewanella sp. KX20019]|uniref:collagenase n=1 Tax=Shewanella sp. KX20019 TaxID=2803864 RepID=UPI001925B39B|nr:collagenase [Shewanella sp. KX20019]QQX81228.1 collagenase [Shewanella sp. KX20019]
MSLRLSGLTISLCLALTACGGGGDDAPAPVTPPTPVVPDPVVPDPVAPEGGLITLNSSIEHISITEPLAFHVDVTEAAPTLIVGLMASVDGNNIGDPDLYVRAGEEATAGETGEFDCVSYYGKNEYEYCIIDNVEPGRYHILVDASASNAAVDATLYTSTTLFNSSQRCEEVDVQVRGQDLTAAQSDEVCVALKDTKDRFDATLSAAISPAFGDSVAGDRNEVANVNIFSSKRNHELWMMHLFYNDNDSGIYLEFESTGWSHRSDVFTFNALEWNGGRYTIRSLKHEYTHALDARFNKQGEYNESKDFKWWGEGLAEYIGVHYNNPYQNMITANESSKYSLEQIFNGDEPYSWGQLAVTFLLEQKPTIVTQILTHMRAGDWNELATLLTQVAIDNQAEFETWYAGQLRADYVASATPMTVGEYTQLSGRSGRLYSVDVPAGTDSITVTTSGGSADIDLWVNQGAAYHPSDSGSATKESVTGGSNEESVTIATPTAGKYYIVAGDSFAGADIVDVYLSVCSGADCTVALPDPMEIIAEVEPYMPYWPAKGSIGNCNLLEKYTTSTKNAEDLTVANNTDTEVELYWVSKTSGTKYDDKYASLTKGESYSEAFWKLGDRLLITDTAGKCLGVALLNDTNNAFVIEGALVGGE